MRIFVVDDERIIRVALADDLKDAGHEVYEFSSALGGLTKMSEIKPDIVIHAHAHNARVTEAVIDSVKIYNVSLPARKGITVIEVSPRKSILSFLGQTAKR